MPRMTHDDARNLCAQFGIIRRPALPDWHAMDSDQKARVLMGLTSGNTASPKTPTVRAGGSFAPIWRAP